MSQENASSIYDDPSVRRPKKKVRPKGRYRLFSLIFLLLVFYASLMIGKHQWALYQAKLDKQDLWLELRELELEQERLLDLKAYIESDDYIAFKARTELGLLGEDEKVITWEENPSQP